MSPHTLLLSEKPLTPHTHSHIHARLHTLSLSPSYTQILIVSHTHTAWICFLCDERDYGIKEARPQQFSSVWTKAALGSSTMTNTDECLATHWRSAQPLTPRPLYILSTRASDWDSEVAVDLFFFRMTEDQQKHKLKSVRSSRIEKLQSPRALTWIYCLLFGFLFFAVVVNESMEDLETVSLVNVFLLHDKQHD